MMADRGMALPVISGRAAGSLSTPCRDCPKHALYPDNFPVGPASASDISTATAWNGNSVIRGSGTRVALLYTNDAGGNALAQAGLPFTWAAGDFFLLSGTYEAA